MTLVVTIAGGSGSGKSTLAAGLARALARLEPQHLAEDDYYLCSSGVPDFDPARYDFDAPAAKDFALLSRHLDALRAGEPIDAPCYDFVTHRRLSAVRPVAPSALVILEGLHALSQPEIAARSDLRIVIDAPDDVRLARRLLRDVQERGRTPASVIEQYFATVRPNHLATIAHQRSVADLVLVNGPDTTMETLISAAVEALRARGIAT